MHLVLMGFLAGAMLLALSQAAACATVTAGHGTADVPVSRRPRHLILILDGMPWRVVERCHRAGRLELFEPPQRVICPFPSMTDLAMSDLLGGDRPLACEARYFDPAANRVVGGMRAHAARRNSPRTNRVNYRCQRVWAGVGYLLP